MPKSSGKTSNNPTRILTWALATSICLINRWAWFQSILKTSLHSRKEMTSQRFTIAGAWPHKSTPRWTTRSVVRGTLTTSGHGRLSASEGVESNLYAKMKTVWDTRKARVSSKESQLWLWDNVSQPYPTSGSKTSHRYQGCWWQTYSSAANHPESQAVS